MRISISEVCLTDNGTYQAELRFDKGPTYPIVINDPFATKEEESLEWYFEEHLQFPFLEEVKFKTVATSIFRYGENLFEQVFNNSYQVRQSYQDAVQENKIEIEIVGSPEFHHFHWEAMKAPGDTKPLALSYTITRKVLGSSSLHTIAIHKSSPTINVLLIVARPKGQSDVGYRTISRPLVETIQHSDLPVKIDIVRPGTYKGLREHLEKHGKGYYHLIHFDVHGELITYPEFWRGSYARYDQADELSSFDGYKAFLLFSSHQEQLPHAIEASRLAKLLTKYEIPIAILNACQSAKQLNQATETSLASRLQQAGIQAVLAMAYSVMVTAATKFMGTLYQQLFAGTPLPVAVCLARRTLHTDKARRAHYNQQINLEDWLLPVLYQQQEVKLDFTQDSAISPATGKYQEPPTTCGSFVGRDLDVLNIENRLLLQRNVLLIQGMAGAGKTTLLHHLGAWWQTTHLVERVFYFGYDTRAWNRQDVLNDIARQLWDDFYYQRRFQSLLEDEQQREVLSRLRQQRHLLILDNLESLTGIEQQFTLSSEKQQALHDFLHALVGGNTLVILGSRGEESWLATGIFENNVHHLAGLDEEAASQLVEKILQNCQATHYREDAKQGEALRDLQKRLAGYPLALQVVFSNLATKTPLEVLIALEKGEEEIDLGKGTGDKTKSLFQCIDYSYRQLLADTQKLLLCLAPFTGVINEGKLDIYTEKLQQQPVLAELPFAQWETVLKKAKNWGLLTTHPDVSFLLLHPLLPYFLKQRLQDQPESKEAIEVAFCQYYDRIGKMLNSFFNKNQARPTKEGLERVALEYENLNNALNLSLSNKMSFIAKYLPLYNYLNIYKKHEVNVSLCEKIESHLQNYTEEALQQDIGFEFVDLFLNLSMSYLLLKKYAQSEEYCWKQLKLLEPLINSNQKKRYDMGIVLAYRHLGMVAREQKRRDESQYFSQKALEIFIQIDDKVDQMAVYSDLGLLMASQHQWEQAEDFHQKSLKLCEETKHRYGQAENYFNLAYLFQDQEKYDQSEEYYQQALNIYEEFDDKLSQLGVYHQLGMIAESRNQLEQAEKHSLKELEMSIVSGNLYFQAEAYGLLSSVVLGQGEQLSEQGKMYRQKELEIYEQLGDVSGQANCYYKLGTTAMFENQPALSEEYLKKALEAPSEFESKDLLIINYCLGVATEDQGKLEEATQFYQQYLVIQQNLEDGVDFEIGALAMTAACHYALKEYQKALEYYLRSNELEPNDVWNLRRIAFCYGKLNDYSKALEYHLKSNELEPNDVWNLRKIAFCYGELSDYSKALEYRLKLGQLEPDNVQNLSQIGFCYSHLNDYPKVLEYHLKSNELEPNDAWNLGQIGFCYGELDDYSKALEYHLKFNELEPNDAWNLGQIGFYYGKLNDYAKSLEYYLKSDELEPNNTSILEEVGSCYYELEEYQESLEYYLKSNEFGPNNALALVRIGLCYIKLKDYPKALEYCLKSNELEPDEPYNSLIGSLYETMEDYENALKYYLKANDVEPNNVDNLNEIGSCYEELGNYQRALEYHLKSHELEPNDADNLDKIGLCYDKLKDYPKALEFHLKSNELEPNNAWNLRHIGFCYGKLNDYPKALEYHLKSNELEPDNAWNLSRIGFCYGKLNDYPKALEYHLKSNELELDNAWNLFRIGWWYFVLGNLTEAKNYFEKNLTFENNRFSLMNLGHIELCFGYRESAIEFYHKT